MDGRFNGLLPSSHCSTLRTALEESTLESLDEEASEHAHTRSEHIREVNRSRRDYERIQAEYDEMLSEYEERISGRDG